MRAASEGYRRRQGRCWLAFWEGKELATSGTTEVWTGKEVDVGEAKHNNAVEKIRREEERGMENYYGRVHCVCM